MGGSGNLGERWAAVGTWESGERQWELGRAVGGSGNLGERYAAVGTWESGRRQWELGRAVGEGLGEAAGYAQQGGEATGRREDRSTQSATDHRPLNPRIRRITVSRNVGVAGKAVGRTEIE